MPTKKTVAQALPTLRDLVDAGAHFGHRRSRSHPKSRPYVFTVRERVQVVNLEMTRAKLAEALEVAEALAAEGKCILFVGTKPQASDAIKAAGEQTGMPYVHQRWLGGLLTNFETIRGNLSTLERLEQVAGSEEFAEFTKKERRQITKRIERLNKVFGGIKGLSRLPDALVVVDLGEEDIAVSEARELSLPTIAIVDTDADPSLVTHPIPANDDSRKTIQLIISLLAEAVVRGRARIPAKVESVAEETGTTKAERMEAATGTEVRSTKYEARDEIPTQTVEVQPPKKAATQKKTAKKATKKVPAKKSSKSPRA